MDEYGEKLREKNRGGEIFEKMKDISNPEEKVFKDKKRSCVK